MLKGFKDFILRGNVIDLAIAVVIGAAFTALIAAFTKSFINPIINVVMGGGATGGTVKLDDANRLEFGTFLNAVITFLITAAVVYFIFVVPMKHLMDKRKAEEGPASPPPVAEDVILLTEIRDLLASRSSGSSI